MSYSTYRSSKRPSNRNRHQKNRTKLPHGGQYIDPARFVQAAKQVQEVEEYTPNHVFSDFAISDLLKNNLAAKGYQVPSPIQDQTIPVALTGRDIIGIANTGTGKTAAFAIPVLQKLITDPKSRALIVAPTRELAQQIDVEMKSIARGGNIHGAVLIGGAKIGLQLRDLRANPRLVIGTPGRIKDHIERRSLHLAHFNTVVLDEVDRMLDMGFVNDVRSILNQLSPNRQSLFFSATMDDKVNSLIQTFSTNPFTISLKTGKAADSVDQNVVRYGGTGEKMEKLHSVLLSEEVTKVIVFDETQRNVERLSKELANRGFQTDAIHGGKSQGQRQRALRRFKTNEVTILVATDVAARGIDVADISHVINYSVPKTYDDYIHRIGRAGRAGKNGQALTFVAR